MHCAKIAKRMIMQLTPDDSAGILVFFQRYRLNSNRVTRNEGAK